MCNGHAIEIPCRSCTCATLFNMGKVQPSLHKKEETYDVNGGVKHGARRGWVSKSTARLGQRFILD